MAGVTTKKTARRLAIDNARRFQLNKQVIEQAKDVPCADCGGRYITPVMEFDHRPGEEKLFDVSRGKRRSRGALLAEIAKCDVVCANCHRIRTHTREGAYGPFASALVVPVCYRGPATPRAPMHRWTRRQ